MLLETYAMAKARKDTKTMERTAASYGKYNDVNKEDDTSVPYDDIPVQPFCGTLDVRVLGIEPIPDVYNFIAKLTKDLSRDFRDIEDVEAELVDLEEEHLFAPLSDDTNQSQS